MNHIKRSAQVLALFITSVCLAMPVRAQSFDIGSLLSGTGVSMGGPNLLLPAANNGTPTMPGTPLSGSMTMPSASQPMTNYGAGGAPNNSDNLTTGRGYNYSSPQTTLNGQNAGLLPPVGGQGYKSPFPATATGLSAPYAVDNSPLPQSARYQFSYGFPNGAPSIYTGVSNPGASFGGILPQTSSGSVDINTCDLPFLKGQYKDSTMPGNADDAAPLYVYTPVGNDWMITQTNLQSNLQNAAGSALSTAVNGN